MAKACVPQMMRKDFKASHCIRPVLEKTFMHFCQHPGALGQSLLAQNPLVFDCDYVVASLTSKRKVVPNPHIS